MLINFSEMQCKLSIPEKREIKSFNHTKLSNTIVIWYRKNYVFGVSGRKSRAQDALTCYFVIEVKASQIPTNYSTKYFNSVNFLPNIQTTIHIR